MQAMNDRVSWSDLDWLERLGLTLFLGVHVVGLLLIVASDLLALIR